MNIALPSISDTTALVVDGYPPSRGTLVSQLREFGVGKVSQCSRIAEARVKLEHGNFDFVLCEQNFHDDSQTGQGLLEDLRRAQLLPFSTVFFMVTTSASYATVADAAESALDGFLLKPYTASSLFNRLHSARVRKAHLGPIFALIDTGEFSSAASLCLERFEGRRAFWLYAARIGAELLLRTGRFDEAERLFKAVIEAKTIPWAKLGVARVQMEAGHVARALGTLERMIGEDNSFADAYDVLGGAQIELGRFDNALATYKLATELTPGSLTRMQKYGMMAYYTGDLEEAAAVLGRAAAIGSNSKVFDAQGLVLLAFAMFAKNDRKGLDRCYQDLRRILEKVGDDARIARFRTVVNTLQLMQARKFAAAVESLKAQAAELRQPAFDFEGAGNFAGLVCAMASTSIGLKEADDWIQDLGLRYASSRSLGEMLARACVLHEPYAIVMRESHASINKIAEAAMSHSLGGDPTRAVEDLLLSGASTLNCKLADIAYQLLNRHAEKIIQVEALHLGVGLLREASGKQLRRTSGSRDSVRQTGQLNLGGLALANIQ